MYRETDLPIRGTMTLAKPRTLKIISGLLLCVCFFCCGGTLPRLGTLMSFEMEDQFRNPHSHADFKGRVLVVIGSDRKGSSAAENWGKALTHALKPEMDSGRLNLIALANLEGVPFFLKNYVRGKFSQSPGDWALMDWKGLFADSYGFVAGNANILVFDKEGALLYQAHFSECRTDQVRSLTAIIRGQLDGPDIRALGLRSPVSDSATTFPAGNGAYSGRVQELRTEDPAVQRRGRRMIGGIGPSAVKSAQFRDIDISSGPR